MKRKMVLTLVVSLFALVFSQSVFAQPVPIKTSPTLAANGFPFYIEDSNGLQLGLCNVDNGVDALGEALGPCLLDPGITNYWAADTEVLPTLNERYRLSMSISAIVEPGFRMISNDLEVRMTNKNGIPAGVYDVVTPYKIFTLTVPADTKDFRTDATDPAFSVENIIASNDPVEAPPMAGPPFVLEGPIQGNLLTTLNDAANPPPAGFVGTGAEVIFSPLDAPGPFGGEFKITGPRPATTVVAQTNLFSVQGKIFVAGAPGVPIPPAAETLTIRSTTFNARRGVLRVNVVSNVRPRPALTATVNGNPIPVSRLGAITITRTTGLVPGNNLVRVTSPGGATATVAVTIP